jgi:hypothetical protein
MEGNAMKRGTTLNELEKKTYLLYHRDGLADLALGLVVLLFGLGMHFGQALLAPIVAAAAYPVWLAAKKGITEQRLGYVEFSEARKNKEKRGLTGLLILGSVMLLLAIVCFLALTSGSAAGDLMDGSSIFMLAIIFAIMTSSIGVLLGALRFHGYTLLVILLAVLTQLLAWPEQAGVIIPGAIITASGFYLLVSFLLRYKGSGPHTIEEA